MGINTEEWANNNLSIDGFKCWNHMANKGNVTVSKSEIEEGVNTGNFPIQYSSIDDTLNADMEVFYDGDKESQEMVNENIIELYTDLKNKGLIEDFVLLSYADL